MGDTLLRILGVVGVITTIITAGVAVAVYTKGAYAKARIDRLSQELADERRASESYRERIEYLERQDTARAVALSSAQTEITALRRAPQLVVDGLSDAISTLTRTVKEHDEHILGRIDAMTAASRRRPSS